MSAPGSLAQQRVRFAEERAPGLAAAVGGPVAPWKPGYRLSTRFSFVADDDRLVVVAGPQETGRNVDLALAYGLGLGGDRDLVLVLPDGEETATLTRAAWIEAPLQVWTHRDGDVSAQVIPARVDVLAGYEDPLETAVHQIGDRGDWVLRLAEWADSDDDLVAGHRPSYLSWHCEGRMVLKVARTRGGLRASAGVHYSKPGPDQLPPHMEDVEGPLTAAAYHRLVAAASRAVADRLAGEDAGHAEHRLQALLPDLLRKVGLRGLHREFPAMRPPGQRAFIDFLAVDNQDRIRVVETKIGPDEMLALQGLDYWIWATAHAVELGEFFELETVPKVAIDFVVTDGPAPIGPYTAGQVEAIQGFVPWRFHLVRAWESEAPSVVSLRSRQGPDAPRHASGRFVARLGERLAEHTAVPLTAGVFLPTPQDGLLPGAHGAYEALREAKLLHRMIGHVRSSQAFALNLFAPLGEDRIRELLGRWGLPCAEVDMEFEWVGVDDVLGERTPARPHQTQVDVLLRGRDEDGRIGVALIEVKLSEVDFGACSGYQAARNDARDVCRTDGPFGGDPQRCFQLRNHDGPHRRRYDEFLPAVDTTAGTPGCLFRDGLNQPMRNIALAGSLLERGEADMAVYALCAHDENPTVWRRWQEVVDVFPADGPVRLEALSASEIVGLHAEEDAAVLRARYGL